MADTEHPRLAAADLDLPEPMQPVANYVPFVVVARHLFVAGQGPVEDGKIVCAGRLGAEVSLEEGYDAARLTGMNVLAQVSAALDGDFDRVVRVVKLGGFVNCTPDFVDHPKVINGASDLMVEVFGDAGRHARFAVGSTSLPFRTAVEVDGIFEIR